MKLLWPSNYQNRACSISLSLHAQSLSAKITHILNFIRVYSQSDPAWVGAPLGLGPQEPPTNQCIGPNSTQKTSQICDGFPSLICCTLPPSISLAMSPITHQTQLFESHNSYVTSRRCYQGPESNAPCHIQPESKCFMSHTIHVIFKMLTGFLTTTWPLRFVVRALGQHLANLHSTLCGNEFK